MHTKSHLYISCIVCEHYVRRNCIARTVTRQLFGRPRRHQISYISTEAKQAFYQWVVEAHSRGYSGWSVKLTNNRFWKTEKTSKLLYQCWGQTSFLSVGSGSPFTEIQWLDREANQQPSLKCPYSLHSMHRDKSTFYIHWLYHSSRALLL